MFTDAPKSYTIFNLFKSKTMIHINTSFPDMVGTLNFFNSKGRMFKVGLIKKPYLFFKGLFYSIRKIPIGSIKVRRTNNFYSLSISFRFLLLEFIHILLNRNTVGTAIDNTDNIYPSIIPLQSLSTPSLPQRPFLS